VPFAFFIAFFIFFICGHGKPFLKRATALTYVEGAAVDRVERYLIEYRDIALSASNSRNSSPAVLP
jgi:hypothetical protein